jgi:hypothetical protein
MSTYSWYHDGRRVVCYKSSKSTQFVAWLCPATISSFHDSELAECTKQINAIFAKVVKNNKDPKRKLALLDTPKGLLLAWSEYGVIGPDDDENEIEKALGLK